MAQKQFQEVNDKSIYTYMVSGTPRGLPQKYTEARAFEDINNFDGGWAKWATYKIFIA